MVFGLQKGRLLPRGDELGGVLLSGVLLMEWCSHTRTEVYSYEISPEQQIDFLIFK